MGNRVSVEISANVKGFQQGMNEACQSCEQYTTDTRKIADATVNFNKELRKAKTDAKNLAASYAQLDAAAKQSAFGKEMKRQLDEAKKAAAEYIDMQGDLQQELKNLASDTRALDTLAEGMGVVGDITASTLGVVAQFTGNEEDARRAVVAFTTAQAALGTVTKIANALQKQSNTMMAISALQTKAAAAAENIKTAATGKGIVATKAATAAQAMFNKVAMANPYVLLATAILTVVSALSTFIIFSKRAEEQERLEAKAAEEAKAVKESYYNAYNSKLVETMGNYTKLQGEWKNLKSEGEKNQWIKDNQQAFHDLGFEINDTADAEKFFIENEQAVIDSFDARARAAAYAAQQVEVYNQALKGTPKAGDKISVREAAQYGISEKGHNVDTHWFSSNEIEVTKADEEKIRKIKLDEAQKTSKALAKERANAEKEAAEAAGKTGVKEYKKATSKVNSARSSSHKDAKKTIHKNSLELAEEEVKTWETALKQANVDDKVLIKKIQERLDAAKKEVEKKKIELGIEIKVKTNVDVLNDIEKKMNEAVKKAEADYMVAFLQGDTSELDRLYLAWKKAIQAKQAYNDIKKAQDPSQPATEKKGNAKLAPALNGNSVEIDKTMKKIDELQAKIASIDASNMDIENQMNLDGLNDQLAITIERLGKLKELDLANPEHSVAGITDAISVLEEKLRTTDWTGPQEEGAASMEDYIARIVELKTELEKIGSDQDLENALLTPTEKAAKKMKTLTKSINTVGDAVQNAGDLFSALGEATQDEDMKVLGIVAKAIATVALSFAQALTSCHTWVEWLAFGISGAAAMVSIISQINSVTGGYAEGGIIGGSSYSGDRLYARVNSGEMVLNQRQQRNLFDMLDTGTMPQRGGTNVQVEGVIHGTDLLLVQQNTNKVRSKTGTQIRF